VHHSYAKEAASVVGAVFCLLRYAPLVKLPALPIVVLDTETTGFVPRTHRVIEYACVALSEGKPVSEYEQLLSIPADIPPHVQVITNIRNEDLVGKPAFADIHAKIAAMVTPETLVVGQNVRFDIGMLKGEGWDLSAQPWIDTSMLASLVFPELASYSLGYLSEVLKLNHEPKHRALGASEKKSASTALF
jgi:DNA polymerase III epsilon subunit-like protein